MIRKSFATGEILLCLVINSDSVPSLPDDNFESAGVSTLSINHNSKNTNVILGKKTEVISGHGFITERLGELSYRVSAPSFFQVNTIQAEKLYTFVKGFASLEGNEKVWDLYCGTGTIGLFLSHYSPDIRLTGIEVVPSAIEDAKNNAVLNKARNTVFLCGKAEEIVPKLLSDDGAPDVVILDPPRKGCDTVCLDTVAKASPKRIVYVSCNPATLARDVKLLTAGGFTVQTVQPVDMFPRCGHVETVCLLSKLSEAKHHISVQVDMEELDVTAAESKATYEEIQEWVQEKYGFHVSHLNIAKTKRKCGIIERQNYNLPKSEDSRSPETPKEKEEAIVAAFKAFQMI
jgi:23S rRNA (uracil1939-C5)-methyltransferase